MNVFICSIGPEENFLCIEFLTENASISQLKLIYPCRRWRYSKTQYKRILRWK